MTGQLAVVGAGFLGQAVADAWLGPTVCVRRTASAPAIALDITAEHADFDLLRPCSHLLIAVAPGRTQDRRRLYVEGTQRVLARSGPWRRVVYISSTSALPNRDGWLFEDEPGRPQHARGVVQREAEDVALAYATRTGTPTYVLRLGGLYGPGRELGRIYRARGSSPLAGNGHAPTNLIHRADAVVACMHALRAPPSRGGIVHVCDDDHCTRREMYARIARARGLPPVSWTDEPATHAAPVGKRVSNLKLKLELGVRLYHPTHR